MNLLRRMSDLDLRYKRVLIREDFNVPIHQGIVTNDARLRAAVPTIRQALSQHAAVILMSHLGRPQEGVFEAQYSLKQIVPHLSDLLEITVRFENDFQVAQRAQPGEVILLENIRFLLGESRADETLSRALAQLGEVFIMDAFATAHRQHASTYGVSRYAHASAAGPLLCQEVDALEKAFENPARPVVAIVGGSKVSTKLDVLTKLLEKVNVLIVGGGIANTFLAAQGFAVGDSLYELELLDTAKAILQKAQEMGVEIPLPKDVRTATALDAVQSDVAIRLLGDEHKLSVLSPEKILDIGPETEKYYASFLQNAKTVIWNGPVGVFENPVFASGTQALAKVIANSDAFSIAGGGDTVAAIEQFGIQQQISYVSTAGGAFLEFLEGRSFPCLDILRGEQHEVV